MNVVVIAGSLWCSLLHTPTELAQRMEMPYVESQIDLLSQDIIQVYETDHYHDGKTSTRKYSWVKESSGFEVAGIALGAYRNTQGEELFISIDTKGKIVLSNGQLCEIPGDYRPSYRASPKL